MLLMKVLRMKQQDWKICVISMYYAVTNLQLVQDREVKLPFLDKEFLKYYMNIDPKYKIPSRGGKIITKTII